MADLATEHATGLVLCVTGPESTGKTALAEALAEALDAPLVTEAARQFFADRGDPDDRVDRVDRVDRGTEDRATGDVPVVRRTPAYDSRDVLEIARRQRAAEARALASGAPLVVADTDLTVIQVWWEEKYGPLDPWLVDALAQRSPRRYLLTHPDLPWQPDPLRESPFDRDRLLLRYRAVLAASPFPYAEIHGAGPSRFQRAWEHVSRWVAQVARRGGSGPA